MIDADIWLVGISAIRSGDYYLFEDDSEDDDTESLDPLESKRRETDHDKAGPLQVNISLFLEIREKVCAIYVTQGFSQDLETGCPKSAIIKKIGYPIFQWRPCYTQIIIINMHLLLEIRHNILIQCYGNCIYIYLKLTSSEISHKINWVPWGFFLGFGCPHDAQTPYRFRLLPCMWLKLDLSVVQGCVIIRV